jgi:cytochrome c oxidase assembly factor CtaG
MQRFFHECFADPVLGAAMALALVLVLTMVYFVLKEKWQKRRRYQKWERRRRKTAEKAGKNT